MNRSKKLIGLVENVFTGVGIGPSLPVKISDAKGSKTPRLDAATKRKANEFLVDVSKKYYHKIPLQDIFRTLKDRFGIVVLQEDGTEFEGFITGREGKMTLDLGDVSALYTGGSLKSYSIFTNSQLVFNWFQMESGNYEINAYLS